MGKLHLAFIASYLEMRQGHSFLNQQSMVAHGRDTHLLVRIRKPRSPKEMARHIGSVLHRQVHHKGLIR
jgi:hypothetical protein